MVAIGLSVVIAKVVEASGAASDSLHPADVGQGDSLFPPLGIVYGSIDNERARLWCEQRFLDVFYGLLGRCFCIHVSLWLMVGWDRLISRSKSQ